MTLRGIGDVTTQDIGQALTQAGTILNPGTYTTTYGGGVLYTPAAPAGAAPGSTPPVVTPFGTMSPTTLLLLGGAALYLMSGKK